MSEIIPLGSWVDQSVHYLLDHDAATFDAIGRAIEGSITSSRASWPARMRCLSSTTTAAIAARSTAPSS